MSRALWKSFLPSLALLLSATALPVTAATAITAPVGFIKLTTPASSDAFISTSFTRPSVYSGSLTGLSGAVLTASGSPAWSANSLVQSLPGQPETYYVRFDSGNAAGRFYTVVANATQTVTVDWNGETPAAAVADKFSIIPYWTLGTLYPAAEAGTAFTASSSESAHGTELIFPDLASVGINLPASATFYFLGGAWRKTGQASSTSFDSTVVAPDSYVIQRNQGTATKVSVYGRVPRSVISTVLNANGGTAKQDNAVALAFPGTVTLDASNLVGSGAFRTSPSAILHTDELYVFDYAATGIKKAAASVYYHYNGAWRKVGAAITGNFGPTAVFAPGTGVIVRKSGTGTTAATAYWTYTPAAN